MNDELGRSEAESSPEINPIAMDEEDHFEEPQPFLAREMARIRSGLARAGLTLMYLAGLLIVVLAIHNAFFVIGRYEDLTITLIESLIAAAGGLLIAFTTWLWKKVV